MFNYWIEYSFLLWSFLFTSFIYTYQNRETKQIHENAKFIVLRNIFLSAIVIPTFWSLFSLETIENENSFMFCTSLLFFYVINTIYMDLVHRFIHFNEIVYKWVHQYHHEYKRATPWSAIDCTISEMIILNLMSILLGPMLWHPSRTSLLVWNVLAGYHTVASHDGTQYHSIHHLIPTKNFGCIYFDKYFNTYQEKILVIQSEKTNQMNPVLEDKKKEFINWMYTSKKNLDVKLLEVLKNCIENCQTVEEVKKFGDSIYIL